MKKKEERESRLGEVLKKVASATSAAGILTEDALKNFIKDGPLSKEILNGLLQNAKSVKDEFSHNLKQEISSYLQKVDPKELLNHLLEKYDLEVEAKVSFKPKVSRKKNSQN